MWLGEGDKAQNDILIDKLNKCLQILEKNEGKTNHAFHPFFFQHFKEIVMGLLHDLQELKIYNKEDLKELKKLSKHGPEIFTDKERLKHGSFIMVCDQLYSTLTGGATHRPHTLFKGTEAKQEKFIERIDRDLSKGKSSSK
ncbi:MAG: hypothetical protein H0U71_06715 [Gammaproteobacteria bacterium]|nr:hypothetical protein [Gammaproteobacteria bacterium]